MSTEEGNLSASARKVQDAARAAGLAVTVVERAERTRTAEEAANACRCALGQIIKSLIFRGAVSGKPYLMLVSGSNRLNEAGVAGALGESLIRPDADYVREVTGYAIGGIPPLGHATPMQVFIDQDLLAYDVVWAAAGTPRAVFAVAPGTLADAIGAKIVKVT
jgi:prolyl-tRNA editing enzyme YbaK/EbsC (Cys-tRNA(Pro) deacylase)